MTIKDRYGQTLDVGAEWNRARFASITINKGKPDERAILLDASGIQELIKQLTDAL